VAERTTIVIPCYNEATRLNTEAFRLFHRENEGRVDFLFVDDGSTDATSSVLGRLAKDLAGGARVLRLERNRGKAEAVRRGVLAALDEPCAFVGFWDADLATPLEAISDFRQVLESRPTIEMVFGARVSLLGRDIRRRARRHYSGRLFATVTSIALQLPIYDTQCGAKLFRVTPAVRALFESPFLSRWFFDVEIVARRIRAERTGRGIPAAEVIFEFPLFRWTDVPGSKLRAIDFVRALVDVLRIRRAYLA
jgi:dolichyl-phosphate beta-glucosyltransferase